jgi:drug/metabolite transporter (DMT)-like permease
VSETKKRPHRAGAFDIRTFIAALLGIYGVVLLLVAIFGTSDADKARDGGVNINLWVGIGMAVAAALLQTWARLRPVIVPPEREDTSGEA